MRLVSQDIDRTLCNVTIMAQLNKFEGNELDEMAHSKYEEAVRALNNLQSNAAYLAQTKTQRDQNRHLNLPQTVQFASRAGVTLDDIDKLSVIHVSGTKGKGSTCAYCESILRSYGYRTGFFSSPHLIEVRERIRIGGKPLSKDAFNKYFWQCYNKLQETKEENGGTMPAYFKFLTIMAYYVFLQEKVDVAIIEVGIGGMYDCTNIVRKPVVCGVSSLGIDHVGILGDTIDKIAWQKAGIFKPGVPAFTVSQPDSAIQVMVDRAKEIGCSLQLVPDVTKYDWQGRAIELGISGKVQQTNASLAMQLCRWWMTNHHKSYDERLSLYKNGFYPCSLSVAEPFTVTNEIADGLRKCKWHGRNEVIKKEGITYFMDGAHTDRSMEQCVEWFNLASEKDASEIRGSVAKVVIFNMTGDRPSELLLGLLAPLQFDCAIFCSNHTFTEGAYNADQTNYTISLESQRQRCKKHAVIWRKLCASLPTSIPRPAFINGVTAKGDHIAHECNNNKGHTDIEPTAAANGTAETDLMDSLTETAHADVDKTDKFFTCVSIQEAVQFASQNRDPLLAHCSSIPDPLQQHLSQAAHIQVLCTGSLHLVGGALRLICPNLD